MLYQLPLAHSEALQVCYGPIIRKRRMKGFRYLFYLGPSPRASQMNYMGEQNELDLLKVSRPREPLSNPHTAVTNKPVMHKISS